jgi:rhamnosyltransferase
MKKTIGGVIVAYYPDRKSFLATINSIINQVDFLVIVNNSNVLLTELCEGIENLQLAVIENKDNVGIARALNLGIDYLITKGCSYFLLLDQDSHVPKNMVLELKNAINQLHTTENPVAAIGPAYYNSQLKKNAPFIRFGKLTIDKIPPNLNTPLVPVDFLITSGSLITLQAVKNVGMMEEGLFIDFVDTEWCLRASKGYGLYGLCTVRMEHSLGDKPVLFFRKKMPMHSPIRHYYIARNAIHLAKRSYIPFNRRLIVLISMTKTFFFYSIVPINRLTHLKMMLKGFCDGISKKYGRIDRLIK